MVRQLGTLTSQSSLVPVSILGVPHAGKTNCDAFEWNYSCIFIKFTLIHFSSIAFETSLEMMWLVYFIVLKMFKRLANCGLYLNLGWLHIAYHPFASCILSQTDQYSLTQHVVLRATVFAAPMLCCKFCDHWLIQEGKCPGCAIVQTKRWTH